jgi:transcriptional regulator with XRE-family HTH domain
VTTSQIAEETGIGRSALYNFSEVEVSLVDGRTWAESAQIWRAVCHLEVGLPLDPTGAWGCPLGWPAVGLRFVAGRKVDGGALRKARLNAGLTLRGVASVVGVASGARVGMWERGLEQPNARFVPLLAKAVNLPVTALLAGVGRKPGLIDLRLARGLSGVELAEAAGVSKMTYYRLEQGVGTHTPDRPTLAALASALGVSDVVVVEAIFQTRADRG